jgi:hypothetical protein
MSTQEKQYPTEQEMREAKVPWPKTRQELIEYIDSLVNRPHDYGTCVYAMSMAAVAAYNYVASKEGATGFQASCADMDIIRRNRAINGNFILLKLEDALYPQYNLPARLAEFLTSEDSKKWLAEEAQKNLDKARGESPIGAHPEVIAHWEKLVRAI